MLSHKEDIDEAVFPARLWLPLLLSLSINTINTVNAITTRVLEPL